MMPLVNVCRLLTLLCMILAALGTETIAQTKKEEAPILEPFGKLPKRSAEEWRAMFPFKSLEDRLAYEAQRPKTGKPTLSPETVKRLDGIDKHLKTSSPWRGDVRSESLKILHSNEVQEFIKREGFGLERIPRPSVRYLTLPPAQSFPFDTVGYKETEVHGEPRVNLPDTQKLAGQSALPSTEALKQYHQISENSFAGTNSFGYVKDKKNVAGFEPHQFRFKFTLDQLIARPKAKDPKEQERWALRRLELVSLLKHEKPVVYVSNTLPRMEDLKNTKTRPLTSFEETGLKQLSAGKDLVTEASTNRILMMGSLRASGQCLKCHRAERGELLGVFSYEMLRDPPLRVQ